MDPSEEIIINNISFPQEGIVEISYSEKRDHSDFAGIVKNLFVDIEKTKLVDPVEEIVGLAREIVDAALLAIRQPPTRFGPRGRTVRRIEEDDDESE